MMRGYGYNYGNMMGGGAVWGILALIFWLLIITGVVVLIVWGVRYLSRGSHGPNVPGQGYYAEPARRDEACEVARMRYAKGEISREQYEDMCRTLGVPGPPPPAQTPPATAPTPPAPPNQTPPPPPGS